MITKGKILDLLSNPPNQLFKKSMEINLENLQVDIGA